MNIIYAAQEAGLDKRFNATPEVIQSLLGDVETRDIMRITSGREGTMEELAYVISELKEIDATQRNDMVEIVMRITSGREGATFDLGNIINALNQFSEPQRENVERMVMTIAADREGTVFDLVRVISALKKTIESERSEIIATAMRMAALVREVTVGELAGIIDSLSEVPKNLRDTVEEKVLRRIDTGGEEIALNDLIRLEIDQLLSRLRANRMRGGLPTSELEE